MSEQWNTGKGIAGTLMATYAMAGLLGNGDFNWHKSHKRIDPNRGTSKTSKNQKIQRKARKMNRRK
jgi:hypothetical protein